MYANSEKKTLILYCYDCREGQLAKIVKKKIIEEIKRTCETLQKEISSKFATELKEIREEIEKKDEKNQGEVIKQCEQLSMAAVSLHHRQPPTAIN